MRTAKLSLMSVFNSCSWLMKFFELENTKSIRDFVVVFTLVGSLTSCCRPFRLIRVSTFFRRGDFFNQSVLKSPRTMVGSCKGVFNQLSQPYNRFAPRSGKFFGYDQKG